MRLRKRLRDRYRQQIAQIKPMSAEDLAASAIVFSPHPDDETLGCGGTIVRKREAGAEVTIVFMTDGSRSHHRFIPEDKLVDLRQQEAVNAAEKLGVTPDNVLFFNYCDGELQQSLAGASDRVKELLEQNQPQQVFVPYVRETHPDHLATNQIVLATADAPPDLAGEVTVDIVSIDDPIAQNRIAPPNFVKVDVEGAELDVLKGMVETIKNHKPTVIYEVDDGDLTAYDRKYQELADFFESLNYQVTQTENSYDTIDWCVGHAIAIPIA